MGPCNPASRAFRVDLSELPADARTVDALARLQLLACRIGWELKLENPADELVELIELAGLADVLRVEPLRPRSRGPRC
jgi:hypothetical protein